MNAKAKRGTGHKPIPAGVKIRSGIAYPRYALRAEHLIGPVITDEQLFAKLRSTYSHGRSYHVRKVAAKGPRRHFYGDLCFDDYGSGLPGHDVVKMNAYYALAAYEKAEQVQQ